MLTVHGIRNCDTVRKARALLDGLGVAHAFHDYKLAGAQAADLERWCAHFGWEQVLNRKGTTFRGLPEAQRSHLDPTRAVALMLAHPSCIKRPVLEGDGLLLLGFDVEAWHRALGKSSAQ